MSNTIKELAELISDLTSDLQSNGIVNTNDVSDAEWPQFLFVDESDDGMYAVEAGTFVSNDDFQSPVWDEVCESCPTLYIHRDAARAWAGLWAWLTFSNDRFVIDGTRFQGPSPNAWIVFHDAATGAQTLDLTGATVTWHRSA